MDGARILVGFELLVGAEDFWARAAGDIAGARRRVMIQAMSFEGDVAGHAAARALTDSVAVDRRVLVDDYSRHNINDKSVRSWTGRRNRGLLDEVAATASMFRRLVEAGVPVRVTNPMGRWGRGYPARNHKKLIVADDVAYLGGINFCDHNYAWHDFMLRLEDAAAADFLAEDFAATFAGRARAAASNHPDLRLVSLDGRNNGAALAPVYKAVAEAEREITVLSPYLTFPFTDHLTRARRRGVTVRLMTPWANNKTIVRNALLSTAAQSGFDVTLLPRMSHLKALLIDGETLIVGSSNFDFVSLAAEEELMAIITDAALIADFRRGIINPALEEALPPGDHRISSFAATTSSLVLRLADPIARAARGWPRTAIEWPD